MSLRKLPEIKAFNPSNTIAFDPPADAIDRWNAAVRAADEKADNVISILDVIGEDFWSGTGVTAKRVAAALRSIGARDVVVDINSPGGDFFEGLAIYNMLREHPHKVTVKVLGLAASAASVIAMAGDEVHVAKAGFLMIHNAWAVAVGNRHDMRAVADVMEAFDVAMADVYTARTGMKKTEIATMLDAETWISGSQAVEKGFADDLLPSDMAIEDGAMAQALAPITAIRRIDAALMRQGLPRSERRRLIHDFKNGMHDAAIPGMSGAAEPATHDAGALEIAAMLQQSISTLKS